MEKNMVQSIGGGGREHLLKITYFKANKYIIFYLMLRCCRKYKLKVQE